jgi:glycosyltransferase involved in cell wall biosynthesis
MLLSIAMIVKNEQENLPRCLESIKDLHAELIIVDTGSVDQTIKIAKGYGAKVYQHLWENNFAKHRNQSFGYATGDWIFQIDADEELVFFDNRQPRILLEFLEKVRPEINAVALQCTDIEAGKSVTNIQLTRIFRNGKVKYKRTIHNEPIFKGVVGIFPLGKLNHYGYDLTPGQKKGKAKRTIGLLKTSLEEDPKDYDSMFYIAQAYASFEENRDESIKWAEKYANNRHKVKSFNVSIFYMLVISYMKINDMARCWHWLEIGLKEVPGDLDLNMALLRYGLLTKNQNLASAGARGFVTCYRNFGKDAAKRGGRFVFSYREDHLAFATFHLALTYLQHSANELENLFAVLPKIPKKISDELRQGLKDWFDKNETIFKHHNSLLQATETARALYSVRPKPNSSGLRAHSNQGRGRSRIVLGK